MADERDYGKFWVGIPMQWLIWKEQDRKIKNGNRLFPSRSFPFKGRYVSTKLFIRW